jgi:predicted transcriptional regulator
MTKYTAMIRVDKDLVTGLKHISQQEGRTQTWLANDALTFYLLNFDKIQKQNRADANAGRNHVVAEGIALSKLPDRPKDANGNYNYTDLGPQYDNNPNFGA